MTYLPPPPMGAQPYPESSQADLAMILSAVGFVIGLFLSCCFAPAAIIAIPMVIAGGVIGHNEIRRIDAGMRNPSKRGQAQGAKWIGIVGAVLLVLIVLAIVILFGFAISDAFDNIEVQ